MELQQIDAADQTRNRLRGGCCAEPLREAKTASVQAILSQVRLGMDHRWREHFWASPFWTEGRGAGPHLGCAAVVRSRIAVGPLKDLLDVQSVRQYGTFVVGIEDALGQDDRVMGHFVVGDLF